MIIMEVQENVALAPYTTLGVGGRAEYFVEVRSEEDLSAAVAEARRLKEPLTVIGGGSNVLIDDQGVRGMVVKNRIEGMDFKESEEAVLVTSGSGVVWDDLVKETVRRGLWGLENLSAIPGSVGATPVQNVGAYGVEVSELIEKVRVYDTADDVFREMSPDDCRFGYRDSIFKHPEGKRYIVVAVSYRLSKVPQPRLHYKDLAERFSFAAPDLAQIRAAVIEIRNNKFPDVKAIGTAGSFFKNPIIDSDVFDQLAHKYPGLPGFPEEGNKVKISLGWILDKVCGLRGYRDGNVGLYEKQALVLVNYGGATATEIESFAKNISELVFKRTNIKIEWEVNKLG